MGLPLAVVVSRTEVELNAIDALEDMMVVKEEETRSMDEGRALHQSSSPAAGRASLK